MKISGVGIDIQPLFSRQYRLNGTARDAVQAAGEFDFAAAQSIRRLVFFWCGRWFDFFFWGGISNFMAVIIDRTVYSVNAEHDHNFGLNLSKASFEGDILCWGFARECKSWCGSAVAVCWFVPDAYEDRVNHGSIPACDPSIPPAQNWAKPSAGKLWEKTSALIVSWHRKQ